MTQYQSAFTQNTLVVEQFKELLRRYEEVLGEAERLRYESELELITAQRTGQKAERGNRVAGRDARKTAREHEKLKVLVQNVREQLAAAEQAHADYNKELEQ